jgi:hypothetical protein
MRNEMPSLKAIFVVTLIAASSVGLHAATPPAPLRLSNPDGGEVRALVIGIDEYQHFRKLKGAAADAQDIDSSLKNMGVRDVTALLNAEADRASVLREISALVERTKANDTVILSIAGHGSQEPERTKGSQPDGMEDVFLLPGFEPTPAGSQQRVLGSEFNHFIRQFELRGAKVIFVADACHGGGMVRDVDPRAAEMSFRQITGYTLAVDELKPVSNDSDARSELDLDHTVFLAAVDRSTKAPEVRIPGIDGLRGALSYAFARAIEGNADIDRDGKVTLKELFTNIRQVVYQLSDQRQNVVTMSSPSRTDADVAFGLTRGVTLIQEGDKGRQSPISGQRTSPIAASANLATAGSAPALLPSLKPAVVERESAPIRLAALDGNNKYFPGLKLSGSTFRAVQPTDNPDLIWDPVSHDVIAWGDVIAYGVDLADLPAVIERSAAIRTLKSMATQSPQVLRVSPDDHLRRSYDMVNIQLSDVAGRSVLLFNVSGDGSVQMLYPTGNDSPTAKSAELRVPLRVREPFGAEQLVAVTSQQPMPDLGKVLAQLNRQRASGQLVNSLERYLPADARIGSIGFFTAP